MIRRWVCAATINPGTVRRCQLPAGHGGRHWHAGEDRYRGVVVGSYSYWWGNECAS